MSKPQIYWVGDAPTHCDIDQEPISSVFVDGRTNMGPWANMCLRCARVHGVGTGLGKGQVYTKTSEGRWRKTAG